ncbi:CRISPR type I-F/YPEST-associated protein Csy3 [Pragia fontium]|uniref:type I-F CRISPR-associated protein Csy3 n=1 Tax=Pragia fontium TaxID=82985 RepID=UPI000E0656B2|nr:type I-F CRISPR-associated protein Csy3 [Pragia fontium]SUB82181.1 CRISPR type I-F/YPEST-associated protein Csy3 [Pragia fontium]
MKYYLVIPHIKIQNANCISSPLTYGFPAITAFTGAVHALSRKLTETFDVKLEGVAIAAHRCDVQRSRPNNYASDWSFIQSRHPIKKDGNSPSIIEEGYAHLDVSLVIEVIGDMDWNPQEKQLFCDAVYLQLMQQRLAGGSVLSIGTAQRRIQLHNDPKGDNEAIKAIKIQISPSFLLMDSQQALIKHTKKLQAKHPDKTALGELEKLASWIKQGLSGEKFVLLHIETYAKVGSGQEVYPSQELILDKGRKSKTLYQIDEAAAMHSQKISNALRTIDTWYPDAQFPIAVEPYGSVTSMGTAFRQPKAKADFYTLFDAWVLKDQELTLEQRHYVAAILIRGGVFGESGKE